MLLLCWNRSWLPFFTIQMAIFRILAAKEMDWKWAKKSGLEIRLSVFQSHYLSAFLWLSLLLCWKAVCSIRRTHFFGPFFALRSPFTRGNEVIPVWKRQGGERENKLIGFFSLLSAAAAGLRGSKKHARARLCSGNVLDLCGGWRERGLRLVALWLMGLMLYLFAIVLSRGSSDGVTQAIHNAQT